MQQVRVIRGHGHSQLKKSLNLISQGMPSGVPGKLSPTLGLGSLTTISWCKIMHLRREFDHFFLPTLPHTTLIHSGCSSRRWETCAPSELREDGQSTPAVTWLCCAATANSFPFTQGQWDTKPLCPLNYTSDIFSSQIITRKLLYLRGSTPRREKVGEKKLLAH